MSPHVMILGGGVGGVELSNALAKKMKDRATITVIDRKSKFEFTPSFTWLMVGARRPEQIQRDLTHISNRGIAFVQDEVTQISPSDHMVQTKSNNFQYDYLIVALGAEYDYQTIPGFEKAYHIYDLESAIRLRDELERFNGGRIAIGVARTPFKCPAAPYEAALLIDHQLRKRGIREKTSIIFFTPEGQPLPAAGPEIGGKILPLFRDRGIEWHPKEKLVKVQDGTCVFESGKTVGFDLLFCVPPHKAPQAAVAAGLTNETGWIPVDSGTLETKQEDVYAIGDVTALPTPHGHVPLLPKAGVFAHGHAETVAGNIVMRIDGKQPSEKWNGKGACLLETGYGKAAFVSGNFLAQPKPQLTFNPPSSIWRLGKTLFEKYWLWKYF
jgi:sulfide:quinone oxidoreductase